MRYLFLAGGDAGFPLRDAVYEQLIGAIFTVGLAFITYMGGRWMNTRWAVRRLADDLEARRALAPSGLRGSGSVGIHKDDQERVASSVRKIRALLQETRLMVRAKKPFNKLSSMIGACNLYLEAESRPGAQYGSALHKLRESIQTGIDDVCRSYCVDEVEVGSLVAYEPRDQ